MKVAAVTGVSAADSKNRSPGHIVWEFFLPIEKYEIKWLQHYNGICVISMNYFDWEVGIVGLILKLCK